MNVDVQLKICVEKAVRPVRAMEHRKDRMREELLAHLTEIVEQEREKSGDDSSAVEAAIGRFGNPADLTNELQQTVPRFERILFCPFLRPPWASRLERLSRRRKDESMIHFALRKSGLCLAMGVVFTVLPVAAILFTAIYSTENSANRTERGEPAYLIMLLATNVGLITLGSFIFSFLAKGLHDAIWTDSGGHRSWLQASIFAAMSSLLVLLMGWVAHQVLKQQLVIDTSHLQMLIAISFVTPLAMAIVARLSELEVRRDEAWGQLDIAE